MLPLIRAVVLSVTTSGALLAATPLDEVQLVDLNGAAFDRFGDSVATDGARIVVGSPRDEVLGDESRGSLTVYEWNGSAWVHAGEVWDPNGDPDDVFGGVLAIDGDTLVAGTSRAEDNQGTVTVFRWLGLLWVATQEPTLAGGAFFGLDLDLDGDVLVVGQVSNGGSAVVYRWDGDEFVQEQELTGSGNPEGFAQAVAVSGDVIAVGAPFHDIDLVDQGSVTVYRWNGTSWVEEQELTHTHAGIGDRFGAAVDLDGDVLVAGATWDDVGANLNQGSATVFRWDGSTWVEEQLLTASQGGTLDYAGSPVAVSGAVVVLAAELHDVDGQANQGAVTVFRWNGSSWLEEAHVTTSDGSANDRFGDALSLVGELLVVGAPLHDPGGATNQGAAYILDVAESPWMDLAGATTGSAGPPRLTLSGPLTPASSIQLDLVDGAPLTLALVLVSFSSSPAPFLGGTLHAFPFDELVIIGTDGAGEIHGSAFFPGAAAGQGLWFQVALDDPPVPVHGASLSNGVRGTVP